MGIGRRRDRVDRGRKASWIPGLRRARATAGSLAVGAVLGVLLAGCAPEESAPSRPIEEVLAAHTDAWMALDGVVGTALGACDGTPCLVIYARDDSVRARMPEEVEGYRLDVRVTGPFQAHDSAGVIPEGGAASDSARE